MPSRRQRDGVRGLMSGSRRPRDGARLKRVRLGRIQSCGICRGRVTLKRRQRFDGHTGVNPHSGLTTFGLREIVRPAHKLGSGEMDGSPGFGDAQEVDRN